MFLKRNDISMERIKKIENQKDMIFARTRCYVKKLMLMPKIKYIRIKTLYMFDLEQIILAFQVIFITL